jgi:hypothetical protein
VLLVKRRRDKAAAVKLMRKLLKKQGFAPDVRRSPTSCGLTARQSPKSDCRLGMSKVAEEQSSREFTSTDTTTRAEDATLQIARISPHRQPLATAKTVCSQAPTAISSRCH